MPDAEPTSALPFRIVAAGLADIGRGRKHNEDTVLLRPDLGLFMVADGAGGHEAGNVASALATTTVAHYFEDTQAAHDERPEVDPFGIPTAARRLSAAFQRANHEIVEVAKSSNRHRGMGTTLVAAWFEPRTGLLHVGHVGDSRCYRLRGGHLEALTHDHSLMNEVIEMRPEIDDDVLARLPRHVVTRALGMADGVRATIRSFEPVPGDRYLLCSDGLHGWVADDQIAEALMLERTAEEQSRLLVEMAKEAGSRDNVATLVIECDPRPAAVGPRPSPERPRRSNPVLPPPTEDSSPEIVVLEEHVGGEDPAERVHVVPAETASPSMVRALDGFIGPMRTPARSKK